MERESVLPGPPAGKYKLGLLLQLRSCPRPKKTPSFASLSPPTHPPTLASFLHIVNGLTVLPLPFGSTLCTSPLPRGANLYDITGSLLPGFLLLLALPREQREEESEVRVFIPLAPSLQGQLRLAVSLGLKGRALLLARQGLYRICPALGSDNPSHPRGVVTAQLLLAPGHCTVLHPLPCK